GHLAGDKVLKKVALLLKSAIREHDFIARIGGEEFVLIFNQTTSDTALPILQQLRQLIEECQFFYHEHKVEVTISFGLTSVITHDDAESIFIRADNAMYKAKNSGRNCIEII
ncbi:MAG: GGDEF domain-containing protein, partial [Legionella sp.]